MPLKRRALLTSSLAALSVVALNPVGTARACAKCEPTATCEDRDESDEPLGADFLAVLREAAAAARSRDIDKLQKHISGELGSGFNSPEYVGKAGMARLLHRKPIFWEALAFGLEHATPTRHFVFCLNAIKIDFSAAPVGASGLTARAKAETGSPILTTLSGKRLLFIADWTYAPDARRPPSQREGWVEVRTSEGRVAFVDARDLKEAPYVLLFAISFQKFGDHWQMTSFTPTCTAPCEGALD